MNSPLNRASETNKRGFEAQIQMATGIEFMRQALRSISPEMAKEFTRDEVKKEGKP